MDKENVLLSSKTIELSETKTYLELLNRVCYYDAPNLNGVELPSDTALEKAQSLVDMPVKAKYTVNANGEPTFRGHEAYIDENGELAFDTENIGVHTDVYIENDNVDIDGNIVNLPCLFSKQKIWTRNKNVVEACKRLFNEGKLHNSWEIISEKYEFDNGIKKLIDYVFEANTFLGYDAGVDPAYGNSAKVLTLSNQGIDNELFIAEALSKDILENNNSNTEESEENSLPKKKENTPTSDIATEEVVNTEGAKVEPATDTEETAKTDDFASLTDWDLRLKITEACRAKLNNWCWVSFHFPMEKTAWVEYENRDTELDYMLFTYEVSEDDVVTVSEPEKVKLAVSVVDINTVISQKDGVITEKTDVIVTMGKEISALKEAIAQLEPFRDAFNKAAREKAEAEQASKIIELTKYVEDANVFSEEELESDEIKNLISELNKTKLAEMISDRYVSNLQKDKLDNTNFEVSATDSISLQAETIDSTEVTYKTVMSSFLSN
jgi:hypothetical protein